VNWLLTENFPDSMQFPGQDVFAHWRAICYAVGMVQFFLFPQSQAVQTPKHGVIPDDINAVHRIASPAKSSQHEFC
jgi:hypothetical protein